jgi:branched-chain amino acid transport system permease protein
VVFVCNSIALTALLGVLIDRGAYRPVRNAPRISALITAIGVSCFLENLGIVVFGGQPQAFPRPDFFGEIREVGGIMFTDLLIWTPLLTIALLTAILFVLYKTNTGRAMRAIARDMETTMLMGVNVNRIIAVTFAMGSAAAAAGGIIWAMKYPQINPLMGIIPGLKAFVAAVVGGIGNVTGAMMGGLFLGDHGNNAGRPVPRPRRVPRCVRFRAAHTHTSLQAHGLDGPETAGLIRWKTRAE